jgi:hypothetical protein
MRLLATIDDPRHSGRWKSVPNGSGSASTELERSLMELGRRRFAFALALSYFFRCARGASSK